MANYYASARSNYFKVKDIPAFKVWLKACGTLVFIEDTEAGLVGFLCEDPDSGSIPSSRFNEEADDFEEIDFYAELATHLCEDEVAIVMEAGAEKLRYIAGIAVAVNSKGETETINLHDIYDVAKRLGKNITAAEF